MLLDGDYKLDTWPFAAFPEGYALYWNFGGGAGYNSGRIPDNIVKMVDNWEWIFETQTYDRATDTWKAYYNGQLVSNSTNESGDPTGKGDDFTKFGHFGKISDDDDNGILGFSVGCRPDESISGIWGYRGGLDDFAVYNGVLSAEEIKAIYDDPDAFNPSADSRLAIYYDFNDPTSTDTVANLAPANSGLYPMYLAADRFLAEALSMSDYVADACVANRWLSPVFNCHSNATCVDITNSSHAPVAHPTPPGVSCVNFKDVIFPIYAFAYDPDGDELKYQIRTFPQEGLLFEQNLNSELPESDDRSTPIFSTGLPFAQTEFNSPHINYRHVPPDPSNIKKVDSFVVAFSDGKSWTEITIFVNIIIFNNLPIIQAPYDATSNITVAEDEAVSVSLNFVDFDSTVVTIMADELPTNGVLTYLARDKTKILGQFNAFNPHGEQAPVSQYAKKVVSFSSNWYNVKGDWSAKQILGPPSSSAYADSAMAWCPSSKDGTGISLNSNNETGREEFWDRDKIYIESGYTEYIEIDFESPLFISSIEIGEVRGCGSIVHVYVKNKENTYMSLYNDNADTFCDAPEGRARLTSTANIFSPPNLCRSPFLASRVRIELDTREVLDWNELDYVKMTGYKEAFSGVLPQGVKEVTYIPDPDYFGNDKFSFLSTDCPYHSSFLGEEAEFLIDVERRPDPPKAMTVFMVIDSNTGNVTSSTIDFSGNVKNPDRSKLSLRFPKLPKIGVLLLSDGTKVQDGVNYELESVTVKYDASNLLLDEDVQITFKYEVEDMEQGGIEQGMVSVNNVEIKILAGNLIVVEEMNLGLSGTDIMIVVGSIALTGGLLTFANIALKKHLTVSIQTLKELKEAAEIWTTLGFICFDFADDLLVYFLVYQYCSNFKLIYLIELGMSFVASSYQFNVCIKSLRDAASETEEEIEKESGELYLDRIKMLQSAGIKSWASTLGGEGEEMSSRGSFNVWDSKNLAKVMVFGSSKEKEVEAIFRSKKKRTMRLSRSSIRLSGSMSSAAELTEDVEDINSIPITQEKKSPPTELPKMLERETFLSRAPGSTQILGCLLETRKLHKKARADIRRFHRARAELYVAALEQTPVLITNTLFLLSESCEIDTASSYIVFVLSLVASALLLGKRISFVLNNLMSSRILHNQQLLDLYHDKVALIDGDQNLLWEEYEREMMSRRENRLGAKESRRSTRKRKNSIELLKGMKAKTVMDR